MSILKRIILKLSRKNSLVQLTELGRFLKKNLVENVAYFRNEKKERETVLYLLAIDRRKQCYYRNIARPWHRSEK